MKPSLPDHIRLLVALGADVDEIEPALDEIGVKRPIRSLRDAAKDGFRSFRNVDQDVRLSAGWRGRKLHFLRKIERT